jgi:hypothetical protein
MAFGKDQAVLGGVAPFGGSVHQRARAATRRPKRSGGSNMPYWVDCFKPSDVQVDTIRLVPGSFQVSRLTDANPPAVYEEVCEWYEYVEHYWGPPIKKGAICSAGPLRFSKNLHDPCHGCTVFWEDFNERKRIAQEKKVKRVEHPNRISMRDMFAYCAVDFALFHKMPRTDDNGVVQMNPNTNQPYYNWTKCTGHGCPGCMQGVESKQGRMQPWPMGKNHFTALNGYADFISNCCKTCGGRDCVEWMLWQCGNPDCGHPIIRKNSTTYNLKQIQEITGEAFHCTQCNQLSYLLEMVECRNCSPNMMTPVRASVFDVDIQVKTQASQDNNSTQLLVPAYSDPKPIDPQFAELAEKPLNLQARFQPTPLEKQAEIWKYSPSTPQAAADASQNPQQFVQPYGGQPGTQGGTQ